MALQQLSRANVPLSELLAPLKRYSDSGEINSRVQDQAGKIEEIAAVLKDGRQVNPLSFIGR